MGLPRVLRRDLGGNLRGSRRGRRATPAPDSTGDGRLATMMKFGGVDWDKVPPEHQKEWDDFYREAAAKLICFRVTKAACVVEYDGQRWLLSIDMHPLPSEVN